jgi:hypothetical protein
MAPRENPRGGQEDSGQREPRRDGTTAERETERSHRHDETPAQDGMSALRAAQRAARAVHRLTGRQPESVISIEHGENGWQVGVEVVETHRIPDSADILATYQAELDDSGRLKGYKRTARYPRGTTRKD